MFAGEQFEEILGDYYLRDRYYNAATGRFTRRDTYVGKIQEPITLHKYAYANSNPVNGIDPSGLTTVNDAFATLNIFSQLAARVYPVITNPVTIETAKAWAAIIGATAGIIYFVQQQTSSDGKTKYRILPDELPNHRNRREPKAPTDNLDGMNQMRVQLQNDPGATFGIPIFNIPEVGVTVRQVGEAVLTLWQYRRTAASWFPSDQDTSMIRGMAAITKAAQRAQKFGGVLGAREQVESYQWNPDNPNLRVDRGYYRVELENLRGHNLKKIG